MEDKIKDAVEKLKDSIVYQMSLGSMELFHSNLWAWMMEKEPRVISEVFFKGIATPEEGECSVTREDGNRDITIEFGNAIYVIENKFKAIPTEEQLTRYKNALENGKKTFRKGILTGVNEPHFDLPNRWSFLSYKQISERMRNFDWNCSFSDCESIIKEYINMLDQMLVLVSEEHLDSEGSDSSELKLKRDDFNSAEEKKKPHEKGEYRKLRIDDLLIKLNAVSFCKYLMKQEEIINRKSKNCGNFKLYIEPEFRDGTGIVNVFYKWVEKVPENGKGRDKEKDKVLIGIQIQGTQFRYCVAEAGKSYDEIYKTYKDLTWFEDYNKTEKKKFKGYSTSMSPRDNGHYNKYNGQNKFVYQYFDLPSLEYKKITELIVGACGALKEAETIIPKIESE